jgi:tetratricopeptide (TPR) repeat protein
VTRLFRSHPKVRFEGAIHEQVFNSLNQAGLKLTHIPLRLIHKGYLGSVVTARNKQQRNRELLEKHVASHPQDGYMLWQLAQTYYAEGHYDQAVEASRRSLRYLEVSHPIWVLSQLTYARAYFGAKHPKKALRVLAEGKLSHPQYTDFYYMEGIILMSMEKWSDARKAFQKCLELGEATAYLSTDTGIAGFKSLYRISQTYIHEQDGKSGIAYLLLAIKQQPQYRSAWNAVFDVLAGTTIKAVTDTFLLAIPPDTAIQTLRSWPNLTPNEQHVLRYLEETYQNRQAE